MLFYILRMVKSKNTLYGDKFKLLFFIFSLIISIQAQAKQKKKWYFFDPIIIDVNKIGSSDIVDIFQKVCFSYCDSVNIKFSDKIISVDSLIKIKNRSDGQFLNYVEEDVDEIGVVVCFFIAPTTTELSIFKWSLDSNKVLGYSKMYINSVEIKDRISFSNIFYSQIKNTNEISINSYDAEEEFENMLAGYEASYFEDVAKRKADQKKFSDYDIAHVPSSNSLKLAIDRIDYFLKTLDTEHPFNKYPSNISQALIDEKINLNEILKESPHTYYLLKASNYLNEYLHIKFLRTKTPEQLKFREDSLNMWLNKLVIILDTSLVTDKEKKLYDSDDKTLIEEYYLLGKLKNKLVDQCDYFIDQWSKTALSSDINITIRHVLKLIRERCGEYTEKMTQLTSLRDNNKLRALARLDSIKYPQFQDFRLSKDNHIDLNALKSGFKKPEVPLKSLRSYLASRVSRFSYNTENDFGVGYNIKIEDKEIIVDFWLSKKSDSQKFSSYLRNFPLGEPKFNGIENYYALVVNCIKDIQFIFPVKIKNIIIMGGSDATPFSKSYELEMENDLMYKENVEVVKPTIGMIKLKELNLKSNSGDKNIGLAFKRGYYMKEYLVKNGIGNELFKPIRVDVADKVENGYRKCDISIRFSSDTEIISTR